MRIAILGAGFTGLSAAYQLSKQGHQVTIFEKDSQPGGLAIGYQEKNWDWTLEKHYHHWFTNDQFVLNLAKEIGFEVLIKRPQTSVFIEDKIYQLDSPFKLLQFPKLNIGERVRMAFVLGTLRYNPFWQPLEKIKASGFLQKAMGNKSYSMIWEPQLKNKFGSFISEISLAWFWARIKKRTTSLAYPKGGFLNFAQELVKVIEKQKGQFFFETEVLELSQKDHPWISFKTKSGKNQTQEFDKVIVTLPSFLFLKIAPTLPQEYQDKLVRLKGLGAINLVLRLKKPFFTDKTYWLSVCDPVSPVMAIVEHTNFMDKTHYNNENLVYLGNYLPADHPYFKLSAEKLLEEYSPFLKRINSDFEKDIIGMKKFEAPFAQPIIPVNYSKIKPDFKTPFKDVILTNIEQVYPWDRGTNYAVELGEKAAKLVC